MILHFRLSRKSEPVYILQPVYGEECVLKKLFQGVIVTIGVFLLLYQLVFFTREATMVIAWLNSGSIGLQVRATTPPENPTDTLWAISDVDTTAFPFDIYPVVGDILLAAIPEEGDTLSPNQFSTTIHPQHKSYTLILERNGTTIPVSATARTREFIDVGSTVAVEVLRVLIAISYLLVGMWAFYKRPDSGGVRALALFSFGMSAFMITGVQAMGGLYAAYDIPFDQYLRIPLTMLTVCFGGFWLNLQFYFPRPFRIIRKHPLLGHLVIYSPQIAAAVYSTVGWLQDKPMPGLLFTATIATQMVLGFTILVIRRIRTETPLERRQITLVLYGSGFGLGILFLLILFNLAFPALSDMVPGPVMLFLINFIFLALLLSPLSFAYAFGRYRLMEVEGQLRRGTRNALISSVLLVILVLIVYGVSETLLHTLSVESRTATMFVTLVLALGFIPAHRFSRTQIERRLYPERNRLKELVNDFLRSTASMPDRATLWLRLEDQLRTAMGINSVIPILRHETGDDMTLAHGEQVPFSVNDSVCQFIERTKRPLLVDEMLAAGKVDVNPETRLWLRKNDIALLLPMTVQSKLTGLLGICFEGGREDMAAEDLNMLASLVTQVGLQSENLRLLEENFDKKRLEEQLHMARKVQERFLPRELPDTPGLEVFAQCQFSLEVAGDYYDVIDLPGNRTLMAVGDVSGKGAGAAMIMANMQAALRTLTGLDIDLSDVVARVNDMIWRNTDPEQYITFFVAIFNPENSTLTYVNAGHNPPMIIHADRSVTLLETGGPILGAIPEMPYQASQEIMQAGDLMVTYTDGVTEAMNELDVEFGEERLLELILGNRTSDLSGLVQLIHQRVSAFTNSKGQFADDFTLLLARKK